jgi:predicted HTH transcriptional regulator
MIDLTDILTRHEDCHLEAKSAKGGFPDSFWDTYSAFANSDGGVILLGVEERADHSLYVKDGLVDPEKTLTSFWNMVNNRQKISHNILTDRMVYVQQVAGKSVMVVEVPRAERMARPVYKGLDPRLGTYRRWGEGDHLCTMEEVGAMLRDATLTSQDAKVLKGMTIDVFCQETIRAYRQIFSTVNANHLWNKLDDVMFLRRIGAMGVGDDGEYYPTAAGLLMFGYEYEITREFPQYFLDYQEDNHLLGVTRWRDRIVSSSGDWSGNLFDFVFKILKKLQADLRIPFVMRGMQRVDDTPVHKLLREATINTLAHADFYGRQGVVITKNADGFTFANPGRLRLSLVEAVGGGISDPRNGLVLKMFSLIRFGERAGSGLSGIMHVWRKVYHTEATICEKEGSVDRTILTLPFDGHDQDVDAMLELYDEVDTAAHAPMVRDAGIVYRRTPLYGRHEPQPDVTPEEPRPAAPQRREPSTAPAIAQKIQDRVAEGQSLSKAHLEKLVTIYQYVADHPHTSTEEVANLISLSKESAKKFLKTLANMALIVPEGGNKIRRYSVAP